MRPTLHRESSANPGGLGGWGGLRNPNFSVPDSPGRAQPYAHLPGRHWLSRTFQSSRPAGCGEAEKLLCVLLKSNFQQDPATYQLQLTNLDPVCPTQRRRSSHPHVGRPHLLHGPGSSALSLGSRTPVLERKNSQRLQSPGHPPPTHAFFENRILVKYEKLSSLPLRGRKGGGNIMRNKSDELGAALSDNKSVLG